MKKTLSLCLLVTVLGFTSGCDSVPGVGESKDIVEVEVSSEGGSATSSDGKLSVDIPSSAIDDDGVLRIEKLSPSAAPDNADGPPVAFSGAAYDISLEDAELTSTAEVSFDIPDSNGDGIVDGTNLHAKFGNMAFWSEEAGEWIEPLQRYESETKRYVVTTNTFSKWKFWLFQPWSAPRTLRWKLSSLPTNVVPNNVGRPTVEEELEVAFDVWEMETRRVGLKFKKVSPNESADIIIKFDDPPFLRKIRDLFSNDAVAVTTSDQQKIIFNDDDTWSISEYASTSKSIAEVGIHEVGHVIGLNHPCGDCTEPPIMAPVQDNKKDLSLSPGDVAQVRDRYDIEGPQPPKDGLVAYYPFDSNTNDKSENSNDGSIVDNVSFIDDKDKEAAKFGGFGDRGYITVPDDPSLTFDGEASFSMWVRMDDSFGQTGANCSGDGTDNANQVLLAKSGDRVGFVLMNKVNNEGKVKVRSKVSDETISNESIAGTGAVTSIEEGKWFHITHVLNGSGTKIYVNSELISSDDRPADFNVANDEGIYLGIQKGKGSCLPYWWPLNGALDEVRVYDRSLSESEIHDLYYQ